MPRRNARKCTTSVLDHASDLKSSIGPRDVQRKLGFFKHGKHGRANHIKFKKF
jgi:hypothetical protein